MPETLEAQDAVQSNAVSDMAAKLQNLMSGIPKAEGDPKPDPVPAAQPEPKPEPSKTEPTTVAPLEDTKGMSPTASEKFNAIKRSRDEYQAKVSEITKAGQERDAELARIREQLAKTPTVNGHEVETLKRENEELTRIVRQLDVERHPRFQAHFGAKIKDAVDRAKSIVGEAKGTEIEALMKMPDSDYKTQRLEDLIVDLPEIKRARLGAVLDDFDQVNGERRREIESESATWEKLNQDRQAQSQRGKQAFLDSFNATIQTVQDAEKGWPVFQKREGDESWNQNVDARLARAKGFFASVINGTVKPEEFNAAVLRMEALEPILSNAKSLADENQKLKEQLASYSKANPTAEGGGQPAKEGQQNDKPWEPGQPSEFGKHFRKHWPGR